MLPFKINNFRPWINKRIFMDTRAQTALGKAQVAARKTAQQHPWLLGCFVQQKSQARNHRDSQVRRVFTCLIIKRVNFQTVLTIPEGAAVGGVIACHDPACAPPNLRIVPANTPLFLFFLRRFEVSHSDAASSDLESNRHAAISTCKACHFGTPWRLWTAGEQIFVTNFLRPKTLPLVMRLGGACTHAYRML